MEKRVMGSANVRGDYADVCSSEWISVLRTKLLRHLAQFGLDDLDASVLQRTTPRRFTQLVSRAVSEAGADGIYYRSKYGHDIENWALFEPFKIENARTGPVDPDDPDLAKALQLHSLRMRRENAL